MLGIERCRCVVWDTAYAEMLIYEVGHADTRLGARSGLY
jgi:hypothetical protein